MAAAVRAERGDGAGAAVLRAGGRGAQDGERARHAPHRLRRLPPGDRRRHAPPRLARRQGVHAAAHGRRRPGLRPHLRGIASHRDGAVLLPAGAAPGVAVHGQGHHQPRPRHHLRHHGCHRVR